MSERLTRKLLTEAMDAMWNAPAQPRRYLFHPADLSHLRGHTPIGAPEASGRPDCSRCVDIWRRAL